MLHHPSRDYVASKSFQPNYDNLIISDQQFPASNSRMHTNSWIQAVSSIQIDFSKLISFYKLNMIICDKRTMRF